MYKKFICLGVIFVMCFSFFSACGEKILPYNVELLGDGTVKELVQEFGYFKESFWKENMTFGAAYKNDNWDSENAESEEYLDDETSPKFRLHTVTSQDQYDNIFVNTQQIDYENQMIVIYINTTAIHGPRILNDIILENKTLSIKYAIKKAQPGFYYDTTPLRRYLVIKMDKHDITNVKLVHIK